MHDAQGQVLEFHNKVRSAKWPENITIQDAEKCIDKLMEETKELVDAIKSGDTVHAIAELCDVLYVVYGIACRWGVDVEPFFDAIHNANMTKQRDLDGTISKPLGWQPAPIRELLWRQQRERYQLFNALKSTPVPN